MQVSYHCQRPFSCLSSACFLPPTSNALGTSNFEIQELGNSFPALLVTKSMSLPDQKYFRRPCKTTQIMHFSPDQSPMMKAAREALWLQTIGRPAGPSDRLLLLLWLGVNTPQGSGHRRTFDLSKHILVHHFKSTMILPYQCRSVANARRNFQLLNFG